MWVHCATAEPVQLGRGVWCGHLGGGRATYMYW
jgi:hypothetical protein